jgi:protein ImuB
MTLGEALAVAGPQAVRWEAWHPERDRQLLEALGYACQQLAPAVAVEEGDRPECLFLEITTTIPYFGSEEAICERIERYLSALGLEFHLVVADTAAAGWAVCRWGKWLDEEGASSDKRYQIIPRGQVAEVLRPLPVAALALDQITVDLLRQLGIYQIDQLLRIPPSELTCRFGPQILRRWQECVGEIPEILRFLPVPAELRAGAVWEYPPADRQNLLFLLGELLENLLVQVRARGEGILAFRCRLGRENTGEGSPPEVSWELLLHRPSVEKKHLLGLLEARLEKMPWPGAIRSAELVVLQTGMLAAGQMEFASAASHSRSSVQRAVGELLDRFCCRWGPQSIGIACLTGEVLPERAYEMLPARIRFLEGRGRQWSKEQRSAALRGATAGGLFLQPRESKIFPPRPLTLLDPPQALGVLCLTPYGTPVQFQWQGRSYSVARSWGPERIETAWWRGRNIRRDYYRVETTDGRRFWIFRCLEDGSWFLHGRFD